MRDRRRPRAIPGTFAATGRRSRLTNDRPRWPPRRRLSRTSSAASGSTPRAARPSSRSSPRPARCSASFPRSGAADVDRAVAAAKAAFEDWRLVPAPERGEILFRFAELLREHKDELTDLMTREMGKVRAEAGGDVQEAIDMSYYMGGEGRRLYGQTTPSELPRQVHDERADAGRRRRRDHAVELPDRDPVVEALPGARLRQHGRAEAGRGHAAPRRALRRAARRGGRAAGRRQRRARLRRGGGRGARPPSRRAGDHLHRLARDRASRSRRRRPTSSSTSTSSSAARTRSS